MRIVLSLLFSLLLCTGGRAQKTAFPDSIRQLLDTARHDFVRANAYANLVTHYIDTQDTVASQLLLDTLREVAESANTPYSRGRYRQLKALRHNKLRQWQSGLAEADRALAHFKAANDDLHIFKAHFLAGLANIRMGKNEEAFRRYQEAQKYARKTGEFRPNFQALNELGNAHRRSGNLEQAEAYYTEAIKISQKEGALKEELATTNNLAIIRKTEKKYDEALAIYEGALVLARNLPPDQRIKEEGYVYVNMSQLANAQDKPREAMARGRLAYERFQENGSPRERGAVLLNLGTAAGKLEQYSASENYYRKAIEEGKDYVGLVRAANQGLINVFKKVGPLDSAVFYLELAAEQKEKAIEENRIEAIAEMEAKFQSQEQQAEIDRLALEDQVKSLQLRRQSWLIGGGLFALGLLGSFLYFLVQQRRRIRAQNKTISEALVEKDTLLKEIHHRVKNNLQMVSSLLSLQSDYVEDDAALDALQMGQSRVRSMAIIHQKLYLRDEVSTAVSARDYLDQLIGELLQTLNVNGVNLQLHKTLENIDLDIDRLIPLGLIANEVITNAMKYAFVNRDSGQLSVDFHRSGPNVELVIADDGPGLGQEFAVDNDSFGSLLIRTFAEQLEGEVEVDGGAGTRVLLRFPFG